jgi:hypothetical protein
MLLIAAILIQLVIGDAFIDDSREHRRLPTYDDNGECDDIGGQYTSRYTCKHHQTMQDCSASYSWCCWDGSSCGCSTSGHAVLTSKDDDYCAPTPAPLPYCHDWCATNMENTAGPPSQLLAVEVWAMAEITDDWCSPARYQVCSECCGCLSYYPSQYTLDSENNKRYQYTLLPEMCASSCTNICQNKDVRPASPTPYSIIGLEAAEITCIAITAVWICVLLVIEWQKKQQIKGTLVPAAISIQNVEF